jgi:DNA topoisomerase-1
VACLSLACRVSVFIFTNKFSAFPQGVTSLPQNFFIFTNYQKQKKFAKFQIFLRNNFMENSQQQMMVGGDIKWKTLTHNGPLFQPPYIPHNIPLIYDGLPISLDPESEEYATLYAKFIDTEYAKTNKFNKNFFRDWKHYLKKTGLTNTIKDFSLCNFSLIAEHVLREKEEKMTNEVARSNVANLKPVVADDSHYKYAIVDGVQQEIGNYRLEPSAIFIGRGCNPKSGKIKPRIYPNDVTINIGRDAPVPVLPSFYPESRWEHVIHDRHAEWLASWKVNGKNKYMWLSSKSIFKEKSDIDKFELARKLKKNITKIRVTNYENLISPSSNTKTKQMACALYLIDKLALRIGNEKGADETDTVGVTTLRVEHISFSQQGNEGDNTITLNFLGKDSIHYKKTEQVDETVYSQLVEFARNKTKNEDLFDQINATMLNNYIGSMMKNLTAKVFRTYNACILFQTELAIINEKYKNYSKNDKIDLLLDAYNKANLKVAILCNHQKKISKTFDDQIAKINKKIRELSTMVAELEKQKAENPHKEHSINAKIRKINKKLKELRAKRRFKNEFKNLSTETSKTNYIDPRITITFFKKNGIALSNLNETYLQKFKWALDVDEDWLF